MHRITKRVGEFEEFRSVPSPAAVVVFVHGVTGDYRRTWASFPDFVCADERFDTTDIYLFGYRTGLLRYFDPDLDAIGERLRTVLLTELPPYQSVTIVAHSMGGLITREAVASVLMNGS